MIRVGVVEAPSYLEDAERLLSEAERFAIVDNVAANPLQGVLIKGTGGLRKALFAKNEASDLSSDERKLLSRVADHLIKDFGG